METARGSEGELRDIAVRLSHGDFQILEKFRGDLSPDAFFSALLRMIDSGAVMPTPEWVRETETK
jgi:hypothetical protein